VVDLQDLQAGAPAIGDGIFGPGEDDLVADIDGGVLQREAVLMAGVLLLALLGHLAEELQPRQHLALLELLGRRQVAQAEELPPRVLLFLPAVAEHRGKESARGLLGSALRAVGQVAGERGLERGDALVALAHFVARLAVRRGGARDRLARRDRLRALALEPPLQRFGREAVFAVVGGHLLLELQGDALAVAQLDGELEIPARKGRVAQVELPAEPVQGLELF